MKNGERWLDTNGNFIQAHGGGLLMHDGWYYWYGENKDIATTDVPNGRGGVRHRTDVIGVACYRSQDLKAWEFCGNVLKAQNENPHQDLHTSHVLERPKVIYCEATKEFVMWMHMDRADYQLAATGIAVADNPVGPFKFIQTLRPDGSDSRDQTVFVDDDKVAYHVCSTDSNKTTLISRLTPDYRSLDGTSKRIFVDRFMEAQCICKKDGRYWFLASGCTGWNPNPARSAVADSIFGPWEELENPCLGEKAETTFDAQSTFLFTHPESGEMIAMFDQWRKEDLQDSRYVWLPVTIEAGRMVIEWQDEFGG